MAGAVSPLAVVNANGVNLYYELNGEHGETMLMIHGSWGDHANWQAVVPGLSKNFRVLTYDRRGHSRSERVASQGSFEEDAQDALALLATLGLGPAHVVGNSGGATIALKLACGHPSVFRSLVIHEPPLLDMRLDDPTLARMLTEGKNRSELVAELLRAGDRPAGARQFVETLAFGPGGWDKLSPELRETFISNADTWLDETRDPFSLVVNTKELSHFQKPAFLSYGGRSAPFFRPIVERLAGIIPYSKLVAYQNEGHAPHISNPDEFVKRTSAFAQSLPG